MSDSNLSNSRWGGRFTATPSMIMQKINTSINVDWMLWRQDIRASKAHAKMLANCGIISVEDENTILQGLNKIATSIEQKQFDFSDELEDIHMHIEAKLSQDIGETGGRLHTARSRNDQVATDIRLWVRDAIDDLCVRIRNLQYALAKRAEEQADTLMPGMTHLQTAQPITFGHHLLAYTEMLERDYGRLHDTRVRLNECPLGAAALAGTSFPIDRYMVAKLLDFDRPIANSLDAVSDRDFAIEYLAALTILSMHLSRLGEEIVLWCSPAFGFVRLSDKLTTGSSIMPQKRNPDAAELVRGKVGQVYGNFMALLVMMKGLPLAYAKDLQEDKKQIFTATETLSLSLDATEAMILDMQPDKKRMQLLSGYGYSTATDLADWLVRALQLPFRTAHHITGRLVALAEKRNIELNELSLREMQTIEPRINQDVFSVLTVDASLQSKISYGGTAPVNVRKAAQNWVERLRKLT